MMVGIRDDGSRFAFKADDPIEMALAVESLFWPLVKSRRMNCAVVEVICHKMICDFILVWAKPRLPRTWKCVGRVAHWIASAMFPLISGYSSSKGREFKSLLDQERLATSRR